MEVKELICGEVIIIYFLGGENNNKTSLLVVNVVFESKMVVSTLPSQGHPVVVKRIEKNHVDLTRTVLLELKQVSTLYRYNLP